MSVRSEDVLAWLENEITRVDNTARGAMAPGNRRGPEAVIRRCTADRKILELHGGRGHSCSVIDSDGGIDEHAQVADSDVCTAVLLLAIGYGWTHPTDSRRTEGAQAPPTEGDRVT